MHSSRTTTTGAITRASTISPRPTSTSGAVKPSCWKEKGSNARPSKTVGCFTTNKPRNINHDAPDSLLVQAAFCLKISDDGHYLNEVDWYFDDLRRKTAEGPYEAINY